MFVRKIDDNSNIIGKNLYKYRKTEKNIPTRVFCEKLDLLGITMFHSDILKIEKGERIVKDFEIKAFAKVLGKTLDEMYADTDQYYE